jgi:Flp pilus assembly protein TadD
LKAAGEALEAGQAGDAERHLARAVAMHREQPEILRMRAGIHGLRGQRQAAIRLMQRALIEHPLRCVALQHHGALRGNAGEYEAVIKALQNICQLLPATAPACSKLGVMLTKCVPNDEAVDSLRRAVSLAPDHLAAHALLADILRTQGGASKRQVRNIGC